MQTTIDAAGRVVIPKAMRDALGLGSDRRVDIVFVDGRIEIEPAGTDYEVDMSSGFPVLRSAEEVPSLTEEQIRETLEAVRR